MFKAKQWDLSSEMLMSSQADRALGEYLANNVILHGEMASRHQTAGGLGIANDINEPEEMDDKVLDNSDISVKDLLKVTADIDVTLAQADVVEVSGAQTVSTVKIRSANDPCGPGLAASGAHEDMWAWDNDDEMYGEGHMPGTGSAESSGEDEDDGDKGEVNKGVLDGEEEEWGGLESENDESS